MIIDARSLPAGQRVECDLCIVGGGAAGISLALELADTPLSIYLLESGGLRHERDVQALLEGEFVGGPYPELHETRLAALGGATALWAGYCRPLDAIDFEARDWIADSGWPFGPEELEPYYRRAHALCALGPFDYDVENWETLTSSKGLPLPGPEITAAIFHISPLSFGPHYRAALERMRNVTTVLHATALRLDADRDGNRVERVRAASPGGPNLEVTARKFVLAAGGIENARLLLLSGDSPERCIGNERGLVGRYFMEHGFANAGSYVAGDQVQSMALHFPTMVRLDDRDCMVRSGFTIGSAQMRSERLRNGAVFFHPAYESHPVFDTPEVTAMLEIWEKLRGRAVPGGGVKRLKRALRAPARVAYAASRRLFVRPGRERSWRTRALFESAPRRDNRVTLSDERDVLGRPRARVHWRPDETDMHSVKRMHQLLDHALRRARLGRFDCRLTDDESWVNAVEAGKHHMGATRMHTDAAHGVVDADCRVHGVHNLYVAGSSVFPTGGFANPTLTIVALAARLANHLRSR
jgi:choline dehydrogenase-like flavoprotein